MKELKLRGLRDYCLTTLSEQKPLNIDEDNVASQYRDFDGWTIHRKRAWTAVMSGAHYDYIDFSLNAYLETGTPDSQRCIRSWFRHLSSFVHNIDLISAKPAPHLVSYCPENVCHSVLFTGTECFAYLADDRELDNANYGSPISGTLAVDLPHGAYTARLLSPVSGMWSPVLRLATNGGVLQFDVEFTHDLLVHIRPIDDGLEPGEAIT